MLGCTLLLIASGGCGGATPRETSDEAFRRALSSVLQGRGTDAVAILGRLDTAGLSTRNATTRACILERLGERRLPSPELTEAFLAGVLTAYREYWLGALMSEGRAAEHEARLRARLNRLAAQAGGRPAVTLDDLEPALDSLVRARGYRALLGVTSPFRELMLWRTETETHYDVELPDGTQPVTVVFLDDFASLGWAGFATCDRSHSGGWTRPDRLYAVRSGYDVDSENFRISYLTHEAQHFSDNERFPELPQPDLEYRAKLAELALARSTAYELLDAFAGNVSDDAGVPHSHANGRVVRGLTARLFPGAAQAPGPAWRQVTVERINRAARELLREDTERLAAEE